MTPGAAAGFIAAPRACLDDLEAFALVGGAVPPERLPALIAHADACGACHELIEGLCAAAASPARDAEVAPVLGAAGDALVGHEVAAGTYRIDALLATGGMGRIYRATDRALGREVALKVPRSASRWLIRRFEREVAITARLAHPGVVPIYGAGVLPDGTPFYAMPIIDGVPLDVAVLRAANREQRLALVEHLVAVASTMAFVHDQGVAHRDLKPQNVLIGPFGETLIIDWGLAKELTPRAAAAVPSPAPAPSAPSAAPPASPEAPADATHSIARVLAGRTTRPGDVLGTPAFMSPEQARGESVDQRSDVYALGAMLEQLLTGRLPRKAADAALAHAPPALVAVCRRAMAAEPAARHADCGELAAELRAALRARGADAAPPAVPAAPSRWPVVIAAVAGLALGAALSHLGAT